MTFKELYQNVEDRHEEVVLNNLVTTGSKMAVIESATGYLYYGVSIDAENALGMCAERAAVANMVTCGEVEIARIIVVDKDGKVVLPTGESRELMLSLSPKNADTEVVIDAENQRMVRLSKLLPLWSNENKY